jgi:hypothetical protein
MDGEILWGAIARCPAQHPQATYQPSSRFEHPSSATSIFIKQTLNVIGIGGEKQRNAIERRKSKGEIRESRGEITAS